MRSACALALLCVALAPGAARAIRPFDGTDAAVADTGWLELELGPVGWRDGEHDRAVVPAAVLNYGLAPGWELSAQAAATWREAQDPADDDSPRAALDDAEVTLKRVLRPGVLQEATGPSVAAEVAALLPTSRAGDGAGARLTAVASYALGDFIGHASVTGAWGRFHEPAFAGGVILEGPTWRTLHPVAEVRYGRERHVGDVASALAGVIWEPRSDVSFDLAFRLAREAGDTVRETRIGVTWKIAMPFARTTPP